MVSIRFERGFAEGGLFMKEKRLICAVVITVVMLSLTPFAQAQQEPDRTGRFALGAGLGPHFDTSDGTAFALAFYGDYYLTHGFSVGPLLQMGFTADLFQFGLTAQAKYTFDLADFPKLKPHVQGGIGIIYADLDRSGRRDEDDTSFLIPLGGGVEYKLSDSVSLETTFLVNLTDLDVRNDNVFYTWLIGVKFPL